MAARRRHGSDVFLPYFTIRPHHMIHIYMTIRVWGYLSSVLSSLSAVFKLSWLPWQPDHQGGHRQLHVYRTDQWILWSSVGGTFLITLILEVCTRTQIHVCDVKIAVHSQLFLPVRHLGTWERDTNHLYSHKPYTTVQRRHKYTITNTK